MGRIKNFRWIGVFVALILSGSISAQLYFDLSGQYNFFKHEEPLNIKNDQVGFALRIGITAYNSPNNKFKLSAELGSFSRTFYQEFPQEKFDYYFRGISLMPVATYKVRPWLGIDAGLSLAAYGSKIGKSIIDSEIGKGFRGYDIGLMIGSSHYFAEWFAIGARYTPYFVKMLSYKRIGDYGEFEQSKNDISTQNIEFYFRFEFLNSMQK